jgi:ABC-type polysaccharide/polyol phosphate transport system ATPase subunit
MSETILSVSNLTISYEVKFYKARTVRDIFIDIVTSPFDYFLNSSDRVVVLKDISFDVKKGEVVGVIGPNGQGKTSLCRYLSGIIPTSSVVVNGNSRAIFESNAAVYPDLTNAEILVELMYADKTVKEKKEVIEEALTFSELGEFAEMPIKNYSRGMKARLYLSLLTASNSDLLIMDEVLGGADQFFTEKMNKRVKELMKKCGAAIIVSHNLDEIQTQCNRIIILGDKRIMFDGSVKSGIEFYNAMGKS